MGCAASKEDFDTSQFYKRERLLDVGAVGEVYLELDTRTNENVAVKYIPRNRVTYHVSREVLNFSACQHPQIISFREVMSAPVPSTTGILHNAWRESDAQISNCARLQAFLTPTHLGISMEYADDGNLLDYINAKGALSEDEARWFFQQVRPL